MQIQQKLQHFMSETGSVPESFPNRFIFNEHDTTLIQEWSRILLVQRVTACLSISAVQEILHLF